MIEKDCLEGSHTLVTISALAHWDGSTNVVRWCSVCGAIVVDTDVGGRVYPGQVQPMRFPKTLVEKHDEIKPEWSERSNKKDED